MADLHVSPADAVLVCGVLAGVGLLSMVAVAVLLGMSVRRLGRRLDAQAVAVGGRMDTLEETTRTALVSYDRDLVRLDGQLKQLWPVLRQEVRLQVLRQLSAARGEHLFQGGPVFVPADEPDGHQEAVEEELQRWAAMRPALPPGSSPPSRLEEVSGPVFRDLKRQRRFDAIRGVLP